jgi:signal transduction histidine kinase
VKIRKQFGILIASIILIPVLSIIALSVYHYVTSPQRHLLNGYRQIRNMKDIELSEDAWDAIRAEIEDVPPNVQIAIYYDYKILISNMQELKVGSNISPIELFSFISNTSNVYDYQVQAPGVKTLLTRGESRERFLVISRSKVPEAKRQKTNKFIVQMLLLIAGFEIFCISIIFSLSKTISSSISQLEKNTQRIANGELDTQIELPEKGRGANEITSLSESLERMRVSLKDNQERRAKFIMGISHDLRTPVSLIKGYSEAITDGVVTDIDSIRKSLSIVESKAEQLENMINDLINYEKLNNTDWLQSLEPEYIKPILEDFASSAKATADVYKRTINTDISVADDLKIPMDKKLANRAFENIFSNALRYTKDGDSVTITADQKGGNIELRIADTGVGIAEKDLEHIFEIFYRGTSSRREPGMGIGLSVVKTVIDSHGWKIDVKSRVNEGTTFIITIPIPDEERRIVQVQ